MHYENPRKSLNYISFWMPLVWYMNDDVRPGLDPSLFRIILLHDLSYWADSLHMTFI